MPSSSSSATLARRPDFLLPSWVFPLGVLLLLLLAPTQVQGTSPQPASASANICYLVADGQDVLSQVVRTTGAESPVGPVGVSDIEAIAYWPGTNQIFAANGSELGTLDFSGTGTFIVLGAFGDARGADGTLTIDDVDGLGFDPNTGLLYGTHRRAGSPNPDDILIQINPSTGTVVADAFGTGIDYVVIASDAATGFADIDDIAIDTDDGQMYGIANNGGNGDLLVRIDKTTGAVAEVGPLGQDDLEGLAFDAFGAFYGTTGTRGGANANSYFTVDKATGTATLIAALPGSTDYEAIACLTDGVNSISGTVFEDINGDGILDGGDTPDADVAVSLYRDTNNDGAIDAGDVLLATTQSAADGTYAFSVASTGAFVVGVRSSDFPTDAVLTTTAVHEADFAGFGNADTGNDFGYQMPPPPRIDLELSNVVDNPSAAQGEPAVFTLTVTNTSALAATGVTVKNYLPAGLLFVQAVPGDASDLFDPASGLWTVGSLDPGATAVLTITTILTTDQSVEDCAEVWTANEEDIDSMPRNGNTTEDDYDCAVVTPGESSGGGDAGVESDGNMATKMAQRLFNRRQDAQAHAALQAAPVPVPFAAATAGMSVAGKSGAIRLADLIPGEGPGETQAFDVSPGDLLGLTNASSVIGVDYLRPEGRRLAAAFGAISPADTIYDHAKATCDRLGGGQLQRAEVVEIDGRSFVMLRLQQPDGAIDYAVSFVAYVDGIGFTVDSQFAPDAYQIPDGLQEIVNMQVWSITPAYTIALVRDMLAQLEAQGPVSYRNKGDQAPKAPELFVVDGSYDQGILRLNLHNQLGATSVRVHGTAALTETDASAGTRVPFSYSADLPAMEQGGSVSIDVPVGDLFDATFAVEHAQTGSFDQVYFADGAWSFALGAATLASFDVKPSSAPAVDAELYAVARNAHLSGTVSDWASLYRFLKSDGQPVDLSAYDYLEFTAYGQGTVQMLLEKASIATWDQYQTVLTLTPQPERHRLYFDQLTLVGGGSGFTAEDVTLMVFYVLGPQGGTYPFSLTLEDVSFGTSSSRHVANEHLADVPAAFALDQNYPNPFNPSTTLRFSLPESAEVSLKVFDLLGRTVATLVDGRMSAGQHAVDFDATDLPSGTYLYRLDTRGFTQTRTMALVK